VIKSEFHHVKTRFQLRQDEAVQASDHNVDTH